MVMNSAFDFKRSASNYYRVDGEAMLSPDEGIEMTYSDIVSADSGFDLNGGYHKSVVRQGVRSWIFSYKILTTAEYMYLRSLFKGKVTFQFEFQNDEWKQETVTAHYTWGNVVYKSQRSGLYRNLKITITEC